MFMYIYMCVLRRLGIFVDGALKCIGNPKELTARFGGFYPQPCTPHPCTLNPAPYTLHPAPLHP